MRFLSLCFPHATARTLLALAVVASSSIHAGVTIEQALDTEGILSAAISPDGKHIAAISFSGIRRNVVLIDIDTMSVKTIVQAKAASYSILSKRGPLPLTPPSFHFSEIKEPLRAIWLSNDLLAVDFDNTVETINLAGEIVAEIGTGIYRKTDAIVEGAPLLLVYTNSQYDRLGLANARTGQITKIDVPVNGVPDHWIFDKHGELRALTMLSSSSLNDTSTLTHWYRASASGEWRQLAQFKITDNFWVPFMVPEQKHTLVIKARVDRDTMAIYNYDTDKREVGELLIGHPSEDMREISGDVEQTPLGAATGGMVLHKYWFDPIWLDLQNRVDAVLPKRINILTGDAAQRVLVRSSGDTDPGTWLLLNVKDMTLTPLGRVQSSIDPAQMLPMQMFSYPAGDSLAIPAYLTRPAVRGVPAPMVVMIHGGPTERDSWSWDPDVQLLAARGYVVFQPQIRGSSGFGAKFKQAGYTQWGLSVQDDITAGVEYLIKLGVADRNRICIYGAGYGGYAALWGLAKTPDLYKCGISYGGVTDIGNMFQDQSDRNRNPATWWELRVSVGDPQRDKEQFDRVSPLKHADRIKAPLLIMHGENDNHVPIQHATNMRAALDKLNKPYEYDQFPDDGQELEYVSNASKFYRRLFAFLDQHIGSGTIAPAEPYVTKPTLAKRLAEKRRIHLKLSEY